MLINVLVIGDHPHKGDHGTIMTAEGYGKMLLKMIGTSDGPFRVDLLDCKHGQDPKCIIATGKQLKLSKEERP
jgi:hypothetical protein